MSGINQNLDFNKAYYRKKEHGCDFSEKEQKKKKKKKKKNVEKGQKTLKFGQKCTKVENVLKKFNCR